MDLIFLFTGVCIGAIGAWFIAKYKYSGQTGSIPYDIVQEKYVLKEVFKNLQNQADLYRDDLLDKEQELRKIGADLAASKEHIMHLDEKLNNQQTDLEQIQDKFQMAFENTANRLFEEKSKKFTQQNEIQLHNILLPLREKIQDFEHGIQKRFLEETKDRVSLKKEIEHLRDLNQQLSSDANRLVDALKGDSKTQGDWGEIQLEMLLQKSGLVKDIHFLVQPNFKDHNGRDKRPDFIIILPEEKHLIIDSKVSLVAYEKYYSASTDAEKRKHLKAHVDSLRNHIKDLNSKDYQQLYQINSPDYLLLFVPIEPAFSLALEGDSRIFLDALDRNIVIVTSSTLLATMRTVSYIWKQEKQKKSVIEIARQSGMLYDKLCGFVNDLKNVGMRIEGARTAYDSAMNKLTDSKKYGDTLIGRAERIKELGAKTSKSLPKELLDRTERLSEGS